MSEFLQKSAVLCAALLGLALAAPSMAMAQMAPVSGDHYAGRASDTGFGGGVGSNGGYGTSLPLALPDARGGLPVPVHVVYGGRRFGAAGLGWDVPLSFIRHNVTVAHRRSADLPNIAPQPREQYSMMLDGAGVDLVRNAEDTAWVARRGDAQLIVQNFGEHTPFEMYDGNGRKYVFSSDPEGTGARLDNENFFLLRDIFGPGGAHVRLHYTIGAPSLGGTVDSGPVTGLSIDLASVSYNFDASDACAKHQVNLVYDQDDPRAPLSLSVLGSTVLARMHKLRAVDVTARESAADSSQPCSGPMRSLRTYNLEYQNDVDTGQFQLHRVTMIGQENTDERNVTLPVATYSYGRVTGSDGQLNYRVSQVIPSSSLPNGADASFGIATTSAVAPDPLLLTSAFSLQNVLDINGDGRPDLLYQDPNGPAGSMTLALNRPDPSFRTQSVFTPIDVPANQAGFKFKEFDTQSDPRDVDVRGNFNHSERWVQAIDMNGDGRIDIIRADEVLNAWVVYLNTPGLEDPNRIVWMRREIDIRPLFQYLPGKIGALSSCHCLGLVIPLSQTWSGHDQLFNHCWKWNGSQWNESLEGYSNGKCQGQQGQDPSAPGFGWTNVAQKSITVWELRDINGDGYPDLVFVDGTGIGIADPVSSLVSNPKPDPPSPGTPPGTFFETHITQPYDLIGTTKVMALLNVAGVHLETGSDNNVIFNSEPFTVLTSGTLAFSAPITIDVGCGVSRWANNTADGLGPNATSELCGFQDVNGDGLPDRLGLAALPFFNGEITLNVARLGTGDLRAPFSSAFIRLPGPAARSQTDMVPTGDAQGTFRAAACGVQQTGPSSVPYPGSTYPIRRTNGLVDINGDGIPDYIAWDGSSGWTAAFGTGAGFAAPKTITSDGNAFELSLEHVGCFPDNATSGTVAGLYDFYGEGQSTLVTNANNSLNVYRLNPSVVFGFVLPNPATTGLITEIDNGYGASTNITYRSAKEDTSTNHLLPSPEMVVTKVSTTDGSGQHISPTLYAYGDASQYFDSAYDRWVFPGYRRRVSLRNTGDTNDPGAGNAVISDALPFDPLPLPINLLDTTTRFLRYLKPGRISDVTKLSGELGSDPWALLTADITTDARRIAASHMEYSGRLLPVGQTGNESCLDMVFPYDYDGSVAYNHDFGSFDQCAEHGFALQTNVVSYQGLPGATAGTADVIASPQIVQTGSSITAFDDLGRVTDSLDKGDLADNLANAAVKDDLCTHIDYALPQNAVVGVLVQPRVVNAPAAQTVTGCGDSAPVLAAKRFEYDGLPQATDPTTGQLVAQVSSGFATSSTVTRYDGDTHLSLGDIRLFDATLDPVTGNPTTITKTRDEDDARQGTNFAYDPFGLVVTRKDVFSTGTNFDTLFTIVAHDPVTLNVTSTTDTNGTVRGVAYDGFGRVVRSKVTPPGGTEGVLSSTTYSGFELVDTDGDGVPDTSAALTTGAGRSIAQKVFQDAMPEANVATTPAPIATTFLDGYGRVNTTKADLGANYPNKVATSISYDPLGRVNFQSDPYEDDGSAQTLYGTSYNYNTDGTPRSFVRGPGVQPATAVVDETNEVYPTVFSRDFANNQEILARFDPDQPTLIKETARNAVGRVLQSRIYNAAKGGGRGGGSPEVDFKRAVFGYDALGHMTSMTRYQDATNRAFPVNTTWHYDSLGWMTRLEEDGVAAQTRTFDSWGEVTQVQWCNDPTAVACPGQDQASFAQYDSIGRVTHREDQAGGQTVAGSVKDFTYDSNRNVVAGVAQNNVVGRLASATWSTGQEWFTYDAFGRINSRTFIDTSVASNDHHYEIHELHDDGSEKTLHLALQDTTNQDEQVNYGYDSAGRVTSVVYNAGEGTQTLFSASGTSPIYDAFGRITTAQYGLTQFHQSFKTTGRRLLTDLKVTAIDFARDISFPTVNDVNPYDPVGRERNRQEMLGLAGLTLQNLALNSSYDSIGQLTGNSSTGTTNSGATHVNVSRSFTYDQLGNILTQSLTATASPFVSLTYDPSDLERICGVGYGGATAPQSPCNFSYDSAGNAVTMPTRTGGTRMLDYFPNGAVKSIVDGGSRANFAYDAFGGLQQLTVYTPSADQRADKYFGAFIKQRIEGSQSVIDRRIPTPGVVATLHGPTTGTWTFAFGDGRGTRFVTDQAGRYQQGVDYQPFGEASSPAFFPVRPSAAPGTTNYENEQWNGGDLLAAFGVVNLGARVYDPVLGRFLSRDPIIGGNPYAFAENDPINRTDPTGLSSGCVANTCPDNGPRPIPFPNPGNGGPTTDPGPSAGSTDQTPGPSTDKKSDPNCDYGCALADGGPNPVDHIQGQSTMSRPYEFKLTPGDGYRFIDQPGYVGLIKEDVNTAFTDPFNRAGTRCKKGCHPGSDGLGGHIGPAIHGEAFAGTVLMTTGGIIIGTAVGGLLADQAAEAAAFADEPTWPGALMPPASDAAELTEAGLGRHYMKQVVSLVQNAEEGKRAALLDRLITQDMPQAMRSHNYLWSANQVPGQAGLFYGSQGGTAAGLPAIGVQNGVVFSGRAQLSDLINMGFDALK